MFVGRSLNAAPALDQVEYSENNEAEGYGKRKNSGPNLGVARGHVDLGRSPEEEEPGDDQSDAEEYLSRRSAAAEHRCLLHESDLL